VPSDAWDKNNGGFRKAVRRKPGFRRPDLELKLNKETATMSQENAVKKNAMNYNKNRPKAENPVKIEDLSLRDGHQSLFATRGRTEDMLPVA
jgi:pyruvate carboxylase